MKKKTGAVNKVNEKGETLEKNEVGVGGKNGKWKEAVEKYAVLSGSYD